MTIIDWSNFFVANAGASAALTGLIFVGVSINLSKILSLVTLPERALISICLLLTILILSILALTPYQSIRGLGIEILVIFFFVWVIVLRIDIGILRAKDKKYRRFYAWNVLFNQLSLLPYLISGIILLSVGINALYWVVGAFIFSFMKAVLDAWVLLVEINR